MTNTAVRKRCPYCGKVAFPIRTIAKRVEIDESKGELIFEYGDDYMTCPECHQSFGNSYGVIYMSGRKVPEEINLFQ